MPAPYEGKRGYRTVVVFDENSMELDPSLPPPWWPNWSYKPGDLVVNNHRFYRCRANIADSGKIFDAEPNRSAWIDITSGEPDVRELLPDAVGQADQVITASIIPNRRLYVDTRLGKVNVTLAPPAQWADGDVIEIVDDYRTFDQNPCTLIANGVRINAADPLPSGTPADLALNTVGTQDVWRFAYYINRSNNADQWLYTISAPTAGGGQEPQPTEKSKPVLVVGPTDQIISPGITYMADTTNGPINFTLNEQEFEDGDTFTIMDFKWTFGDEGKQAVLKPSANVKYQDGDPDDGAFYMNVKGPTAGWPFLYYAGVVMCMNAPLDQQWIDGVVQTLNILGGHTDDQPAIPQPSGAIEANPMGFAPSQMLQAVEQAVAPYPTFTTVLVVTDVLVAQIWTQYNVDMGRKKTLTVGLPKVMEVPARSRIRVRLISAGRGVVNVLPDSGDQILGMFGNLNATPKGVPRTVHGQYSMIELEADEDHWIVV